MIRIQSANANRRDSFHLSLVETWPHRQDQGQVSADLPKKNKARNEIELCRGSHSRWETQLNSNEAKIDAKL